MIGHNGSIIAGSLVTVHDGPRPKGYEKMKKYADFVLLFIEKRPFLMEYFPLSSANQEERRLAATAFCCCAEFGTDKESVWAQARWDHSGNRR